MNNYKITTKGSISDIIEVMYVNGNPFGLTIKPNEKATLKDIQYDIYNSIMKSNLVPSSSGIEYGSESYDFVLESSPSSLAYRPYGSDYEFKLYCDGSLYGLCITLHNKDEIPAVVLTIYKRLGCDVVDDE